jgi:hypothetical protein
LYEKAAHKILVKLTPDQRQLDLGQLVAPVVGQLVRQGRSKERVLKPVCQDLPELKNLETSFESKVEQPKKCISAILKN